MLKGQASSTFSITALALLAFLLTTPDLAASPDEQINKKPANHVLAVTEWLRQFNQNMCLNDGLELPDQLLFTKNVYYGQLKEL